MGKVYKCVTLPPIFTYRWMMQYCKGFGNVKVCDSRHLTSYCYQLFVGKLLRKIKTGLTQPMQKIPARYPSLVKIDQKLHNR